MFEVGSNMDGTPAFDVFDGLEEDHQDVSWSADDPFAGMTKAALTYWYEHGGREEIQRILNYRSPLMDIIDRSYTGDNTYYTTCPASICPYDPLKDDV